MENRTVIILAIIMNTCHKIDSVLSGIPRDTEVKVNDSTYLNCSTSLLANRIHWRHGKNYIYTGIAIIEPYNDRFSVEISASTGACNLVIRSAQPSDAGTYECAEDEGFGEQRRTKLIVLDHDPVCKSNMHPDGIVGPNSCGIEPEEVKLSCSVEFHGNSLPILEWKARLSGENQSTTVTDGLIDVTSINNEVTYTLTMNSSLGLNNSSFICQTSRTSDSYKHYSCSSEVINILYVFSSEVTVNMTMNDEVNCLANTTQSCSYKWKWFDGEDSSTESDKQILKPRKVGMHRCEATCSIRNKSCFVHSMHATVDLEEATSQQSRLALLALLILPALCVFGVIVYCWRKRMERRRLRREKQRLGLLDEERQRREEEELPRKLVTTKAAKEKGLLIKGITILGNELFAVTQQCSEVEIFECKTLESIRHWTLNELIRPSDIASCKQNRCLYIMDWRGDKAKKEVLRVDPDGTLLCKWETGDDYGYLISVSNKQNIIMTCFGKYEFNEYSPDGTMIRKISTQGVDVPTHAIKLANGDFMISSGEVSHRLHRMCIVGVDGKVKKSFGSERGSDLEHMDHPIYLNVCKDGSVAVLESGNRRVLLLDKDLKFKRVLLSHKMGGLNNPSRLLVDESSGRLFVVDIYNKAGAILVFQEILLKCER